MAMSETIKQSGILKCKDSDGNIYELYPDNGITMSYEGWMALPEEERNTGAYYIPDGDGGGVSAANELKYDNSTSGLEATNTQDAIDELKGVIEGVNENFSQAHDTLVASLANSGLGITSENTFAEISVVLAEYFPGKWWSYNAGVFKDNYTATTNSGSSFTKNANNMSLNSPKSGSGAYLSVLSDSIDFTQWNNLIIVHSESIGNNVYNTKCAVGYCTSLLTMGNDSRHGWNEATFVNGKGNFFAYNNVSASQRSSIFDISGISGKYKIGLFCSGGANGGATLYVTQVYLTK